MHRVGSSINLITSEANRLDYTIAHAKTDYKFSVTNVVNNAWTMVPDTTVWIYIDHNLSTTAVTYGYTTIEPVYQSVRPVGIEGQLWFDTAHFRQYQFTNGSWVEVLRIVLAEVIGHHFTSISINSNTGQFNGTQIGAVGDVATEVGIIIYDELGNPVRKRSGEFLTSASEIFTTSSLVNQIKIEATIVNAVASEPIGAYQIVKWHADGTIAPATYEDSTATTIGIAYAAGATSATVPVTLQGLIPNPMWNWPASGAVLWINRSGYLTSSDPHAVDPVSHPVSYPPVARVITHNQIFFDQGLTNRWAELNISPVKSVNFHYPDLTGNIDIDIIPDQPLADAAYGRQNRQWVTLDGSTVPVKFEHLHDVPTTVDGIGLTDAVKTSTTITTGPCMQVTGTLADDNVKISLRPDPSPTNMVHVTPDGMLVDLDIIPTDGIVVERPTANSAELSLVIDASTRNLLSLSPNGLLSTLNVTPSETIELTGRGTIANPLAMELKIDPVNTNALKSNPNGAYVEKAIGTYSLDEVPFVDGTEAIAIGSGARAVHDGSVALGTNISTTAANQVIIGTPSRPKVLSGLARPVGEFDAVNLGYLNSSGFIKGVIGGDGIVIDNSIPDQTRFAVNLATGANQSIQIAPGGRLLVPNSSLKWSRTEGSLTFTDNKGNVNVVPLEGIGTDTIPTSLSFDPTTGHLTLLTSNVNLPPLVADLSDISGITTVETDTIGVTGQGTASYPMSFGVKLNPSTTNRIMSTPTGLLVQSDLPIAAGRRYVGLSNNIGQFEWVAREDAGLVTELIPGQNITIDNTDPIRPIISAAGSAQTNADWLATSGPSQILNKPVLGTASSRNANEFATAQQGQLATTAVQPSSLAPVATSGVYNDLIGRPTIPVQGIISLLSLSPSLVVDSSSFPNEVKISLDDTKLPQADWGATSGPSVILNKPLLGTAASASIDSFATAQQGQLAATAVQPNQIGQAAKTNNYFDLDSIPILQGENPVTEIIGTGGIVVTRDMTDDDTAKIINLSISATSATIDDGTY